MKKNLTTIARLFALTAVVLLVSTTLFAQSGHEGGCSCGKRGSTPIAWEIDHTTTSYQNAASAELNRWNNYVDIFRPAVGDGSAGVNNKNEIVFFSVATTKQVYGIAIDSNTFGVTYISPQSSFGTFNECPIPFGQVCTGAITETDVIMNADFSRGFTPTGPPDFDDSTGPANYGATAVHEIGHALGLHHNFNNLSTMNYYEDYACQYIGMSDTAAVRANYPGQVKSVTDLATYPFYYDPNFTQYDGTEPVTISPTTVAPGGTIKISNVTIENPGTVSVNGAVLRFYLSSDATITTSDTAIAQITYTSAFTTSNFDEIDSSGANITLPASLAPGTYYLGAAIFYNTNQQDTVTYNNSWVAPQQVTVTGGGGGTGPCSPNRTTLCLLSNRFKATVTANNPRDGKNGTGIASPETDKYGWFSLPDFTFDETNAEIFIKMVDGRALNNKFWVFYGGLTDLKYVLTVTDTTTGVTKTFSDKGTYCGFADTNAF